MKQINRKRINKIDYFVGVFVSAILNSATTVPALFEGPNDSKRVEFTTNLGHFNVYVKYSTSRLVVEGDGNRKKGKKYWNVQFTDTEYGKLGDFKKDGSTNYVVIVCGNVKLTTTWIAVLDFDKAYKCLEKTAPRGSRRITVVRYGNEQKFYYGGVGYDESEYVCCFFDHTRYFDKAVE